MAVELTKEQIEELRRLDDLAFGWHRERVDWEAARFKLATLLMEHRHDLINAAEAALASRKDKA